MFWPQAQSVPSACTATVWPLPAAALAQLVAVPTCPGTRRLIAVPLPNWPVALSPQAQRVPSVRTATVWPMPAAALAQLVAVPTCPGVGLLVVVVPVPSWP